MHLSEFQGVGISADPSTRMFHARSFSLGPLSSTRSILVSKDWARGVREAKSETPVARPPQQ